MSERLTFVLTGRDDLSRTLNSAGDSAVRLHRRIDGAMTSSSASVNRFVRDANGRLRDLNGRFVSAGAAARGMGGGMPGVASRIGQVAGAAAAASAALGGGAGLMVAAKGVGVAVGVTLLPAVGALVPMMAGLALTAGTLKLGFAGVSEAVEESTKDKKKYKELLKKMGPDQRAFTKELVATKKEFKGVGRDVQKAMLPGFTRAVKDAGPLVKILRRNMVDLGGTFGKAAQSAGKVFKDSGFQEDLKANLSMGKRFVGDMLSGFGKVTRSVLSFGAASKPTLTAISSGISATLGKALPGMFEGLKSGISGSSKFLTGLFSGINMLLPALGRFAGTFANTFGPMLGSAFRWVGRLGSALLDGLRPALDAVKPAFDMIGQQLDATGPAFARVIGLIGKGLGGALRIGMAGFKMLFDVIKIAGPIVGNLGSALTGLFPAFDGLDGRMGWLDKIENFGKTHKLEIQAVFSQAASGVMTFIQAVVAGMPTAFAAFRTLSSIALTAFGVMINGAAETFGWIPGIGDKIRGAARGFNDFAASAQTGLGKAQGMIDSFSRGASARLKVQHLKMNISNWETQLKTAKSQLKSVPASKRSALLAKIDDLEAKIRKGKADLRSVPSQKKAELKAQIASWSSQISKAKGQLRSVPPSKRASLLAKISDLEAKVRRARSALASVSSKTITITTNYVTRRSASKGATFGRNGSYWNADGNIFKAYAAGGIERHVAQIAPGRNAVRMWAEPETGGEAYIPLAASKRGRSMAILEEVAQRFGYRLERFAQGGVAGMAGAGVQAARGLAGGMSGGLGLVEAAARRMAGGVVTGIKGELQIASPSKRTRALAKDVGSGLIKGLTGSRDKIKATSKDLAKDIWSAFTGRKDNFYVSYVNRQTKKLLSAASKRDALASTIKRAKEFAETTRVGAKKAASLGGMFEGEEEVTASGINSKLQQRLAKMKTFTSYIKTLASRGLNKTMLREILEMGPEDGYAYASALAGSSSALLKSINTTQYGVNDAAYSLGRIGADRLYDSGKNASKGFLEGLKSQQKAIESYMTKVAKGMQKALRRALGIRSPSTVMAKLGRYSTEGLAVGLTQRLPVLDRALGTVAGRVAATQPVLGRPAVAGGASGGSMNVQVDINGAIDPVATARELQKMLLKLKREYGLNVSLGVA